MAPRDERAACPLAELAEHIGDNAAGGRGSLGLAGLLTFIANEHQPRPDGACTSCGLGDTPWPCAEWLEGMTAAVEWVRGSDT
jgi:hypothetical protein